MIELVEYWGDWGIDIKPKVSILEREVDGNLKVQFT